jgi:hypothetical protein
MLEAKIEEAVCNYAKSKGFLAYKFTSPNRAAVPDRLFILPSGHMFFIEFKREGQKPTIPQAREHARLRQQNVQVYVVDSIDQGKDIINSMCAGLGL